MILYCAAAWLFFSQILPVTVILKQDSHAVVDPLADPQQDAKRQEKIREFSRQATGPAVLNRFENLLLQERAKQNEEMEKQQACKAL